MILNIGRASAKTSESSPVSSVRLTEVTRTEDFESLRSEWDGVVDRLALSTPFTTWEWNWVWWKHFGSRRHLRLLLCKTGGELIGLVPLYERRLGNLSFLAPLGWESYEQRFGITEQTELPFLREDKSMLLDSLWTWFMDRRGTTIVLPLGANRHGLPDPMAAHVVRRGSFELFSRELEADWLSFLRGLNKSLRDNVKYYPRLLHRSGYDFAFRVARTPQEVSASLPQLMRLHSARANADMSVQHRDYFQSARRREFFSEVAPLLASAGMAKIGLLEVNGETVACQMWLEKGDTLYFYYSGFLPTWSKYSVALITTVEILKLAIANGTKRVEFLRGPGHFKERWRTVRREDDYAIIARYPRFITAMSGLFGGWRRPLRQIVPALR